MKKILLLSVTLLVSLFSCENKGSQSSEISKISCLSKEDSMKINGWNKLFITEFKEK